MNAHDTAEVVRAYHDAWARKDYDRARALLADTLTVEVPVSRPHVQPFACAYHYGKLNAKSMPATSRPVLPRRRISSSRSSGRDRPFSRRRNTPSSITAIHVVRPVSSRRPDQSMATTVNSVTVRS